MRRKRTGIRCRVKSAGRKPARLCFRQPAPVFSFFLAAAVLAGMSSHAAFSALGNEDVPEMSRGTQIMDRLSAEGGLMQDGRVWAGLEAGETEAETGIPGQEEEPSEDKADQPGWEAWQPVWEAWQPGREAWQPGQETEQPERETRQSGQETVQPYEGPGLSDQTDPGIDVGDELFMLLPDEMEPDTEEEEKWGPEDDGCLTIGIGGSQYPFAWIPEDAVYPDYTEYSGIDLDAAVQIAADLDMILQFRAYSSEREAMQALLAGEPAVNMLLYGDAGTGKSSTIKAIVNEYREEEYREIIRRGHEIGVHSTSHDYGVLYADIDAFIEDVSTCRDYVENVTGHRLFLYRFPGGTNNQVHDVSISRCIEYLQSVGLTHFDWNISSGDAAGITVDKEELVNNLLGRIHENGNSTLVVLMHDSAVKTTTLEALKEVLPILIQEGYGFSKITTETPQIYFEAYD